MVKNVPVPPADRARLALTDDEVLNSPAGAASSRITTPPSAASRADGPGMGQGRHTGELFIVQARPETVQSRKSPTCLNPINFKPARRVLASGRSVGEKIATGRVRVIKAHAIGQFQEGEVLVTDKTDPDWQPIMKKAAAIITNRGGRTCHAAIVSRELGVPAIVGTEHGTEALKDGQMVTVSCAEGDTGFVYEGAAV
jgi:pyruvate, water dikinase